MEHSVTMVACIPSCNIPVYSSDLLPVETILTTFFFLHPFASFKSTSNMPPSQSTQFPSTAKLRWQPDDVMEAAYWMAAPEDDKGKTNWHRYLSGSKTEAAKKMLFDTNMVARLEGVTPAKAVTKLNGMYAEYKKWHDLCDSSGWGVGVESHDQPAEGYRHLRGASTIRQQIMAKCPWYYIYEAFAGGLPNVTPSFLMETGQPNRRNLEIEEALPLASDASTTDGEEDAEGEVVSQESPVAAEEVVQEETTSMNPMENLTKGMTPAMEKILEEHLSDQSYNERQDAEIFGHIDVPRTQEPPGKRLEEPLVVEDHISSDEEFPTHTTLIRPHVGLDTEKAAALKLPGRPKALPKSPRSGTPAPKASAKVTSKTPAKAMPESSTKAAPSTKKPTANALVSKRKQAKDAEVAGEEDLDSGNERRKKTKSTVKNISLPEAMLESSKAQVAQAGLEMNARHQQADRELEERRRQHQSDAEERRLVAEADRLRREQHHELLMQQGKERGLQLELQLATLRAGGRGGGRGSGGPVDQDPDQDF